MHTGLGVVEPPRRAVLYLARAGRILERARDYVEYLVVVGVERIEHHAGELVVNVQGVHELLARPSRHWVWPMLSKPVSGPSCLNMSLVGVAQSAVSESALPSRAQRTRGRRNVQHRGLCTLAASTVRRFAARHRAAGIRHRPPRRRPGGIMHVVQTVVGWRQQPILPKKSRRLFSAARRPFISSTA